MDAALIRFDWTGDWRELGAIERSSAMQSIDRAN